MVPKPLDSDDEDVGWALTTAETMWSRGDKLDAIKWIRKAATAASEADDVLRAANLASAAADLAEQLEPSFAPPPAAPLLKTQLSQTSPSAQVRPKPAAPRGAAPAAPRAKTAPLAAKPQLPTTPRPAAVEPEVESADDWELAEEEPRKPQHTPAEFSHPPTVRGSSPQLAPLRPNAHTLADFHQKPPPKPLVPSQAFRVVLWKDARGVHVAPSGTVVSAITVDALLVALDPSVDLTAWLSDKRET